MIPYLNFNYIYPPRPEFKIPPTELHKFEGQEYLAQPKYNGTCCLVFTNGDDVYVYNRHKNPLSNLDVNIEFSQLAKTNQWYVYAGEYLNKGKIGESQCGNDEFLIGSQGTWNTYYEVENVEGNEG